MGGLWIFGDGNNGTAQWQPDPTNGRGTWTILSTCIITLALCVYTALHLNIPAHKSGIASSIGIKVKYVLFGLLAPELIVFNAWRQRTVAASIVAQLRRKRGGKKPTPLLQRLLRQFRTSCRMMLAALKSVRWRHIQQLIQDEKEVISIRASQLLLTSLPFSRRGYSSTLPKTLGRRLALSMASTLLWVATRSTSPWTLGRESGLRKRTG